jgi:hypothetical protein
MIMGRRKLGCQNHSHALSCLSDSRFETRKVTLNDVSEFADRVQGRMDRLDLSIDALGRLAALPASFIHAMLAGEVPPPRGKRLVKLADALATSVSYLVGLDPDVPVPDEYLEEDQGSLGLLAGDEDALLRAYRRLDMSSKAALLQVALKMAPEPDTPEKKARQVQTR